MFKSVSGISYLVSDIEKARNWYSEILNTKPIVDASIGVAFSIGDSMFGLIPATDATIKTNDSVIVNWTTDDIYSDYERLLQLGATKRTEIDIVYGGKGATVIDPFENILGLFSTLADANKKTVEQQPSQTAMGVTKARAVSFIEEREEIRGSDYLAEIFLSKNIKDSLKDKVFWKKVMADNKTGIYEMIIARTAYFDNIVQQALRENFSQIVFLGAGYDTRPYRFRDLIKDTIIFELDIHTTQQHKMKLLHQHNISIPEQLNFVTINFNAETLGDVLFKAGYKNNEKNLFIWEGVTYYLSPKAVDDTLYFIKSSSSTGSTICFDYMTRGPEMKDAYGVKESIELMRTNNPGEPTRFGIERGKIEPFLSDMGYKIINHLTAKDMERKFLTLLDGSLVGNVLGASCLVHASVSD